MSACRHCHERITFVRIETTGRAMPVDPYPDPDGNVYARRSAGQLLGHVAHDGEQLPTGWRVYMLHFATCSNAPAPKEPEPTPEPELTLFDNQPGGTNE